MPEIARDAVEMCCTICMMITCNTRAYKSHKLSEETHTCDSRAPRRVRGCPWPSTALA